MDIYLELSLRLLLAQYGKRRLLITLAKLGDQSIEELDKQLEALQSKRAERKKRRPLHEVIASSEVESRDPETKDLLSALANAYENRQLMPNLRDVRKFLEKHGAEPRKLRSREDAGPLLFRVFATALSKDELKRL